MLSIFLAPISVSFQKTDEGSLMVGVGKNIVLAEVTFDPITQINITETTASFKITIKNTTTDYIGSKVLVPLYAEDPLDDTQGIPRIVTKFIPFTENTPSQEGTVEFTDLTASTQYFFLVYLVKEGGGIVSRITTNFTTNPTGGSGGTIGSSKATIVSSDFGCGLLPSDWPACFVAVFYYLVFVPISFITELTAKLLDFFVYYSTNSSSYSASFVGSAWAVVRDIANIFFIVALLYLAIQVILGLGAHTKKMISTIVIVAILINFSLFFTQVIIDGSNILAKVFYNNIESKDKDGKILDGGAGGQKSITVAIVSAFQPQNTMDRTDTVNFFIVMLIFTILQCYMIFIFISVAMLFVARVAGLWIAMIFAPLAFASYTLPFDIPGFGHKKWWDDLLKQAFMAPIFIFMLYIILLLSKTFDLIKYDIANSTDKIDHLMTIIIPALIIFVLLQQAKSLAVKYSGEIGAAMSKAGAMVGGLALGGAFIGAAVVGRKTVGAFMKGASTGDSLNQRFADPATRAGMTNWEKMKGGAAHYGTFGGLTAAQKWTGKKLNKDQEKVEGARSARHELDTTAGNKFGGKKFGDLNSDERDKVRESIAREKKAEADHGKKYNQLTATQKITVDTAIAPGLAAKTSHADDLINEAKHKQGLGSSLAQASRTGSFDVRNLSKIVAGDQDKSFNKLATGLTSIIATGIRGSIKGALGAQYGEGQKDFLKDLGHTISEAMKGANVNVDLSNVGKEKKEGEK